VNTLQAREECATRLLASEKRVAGLKAFIGLDGFVDEILHVVDKRESADKYVRLPTIAQLAARLAGAAGRSANIELVSQLTKLGGNGPIMANALASFGLRVTYLGNLGYPNLHPVFAEFAKRAEVHSIAEPGYTDALEFEDGKIMLGKHYSLRQVNWENIKSRFGIDRFTEQLVTADLVGFVNWTMLTAMSDVWSEVLNGVCPKMGGPRRRLFFDLADPEKRTAEDIMEALKLIVMFQKYFDVILGLNEKESYEIADVLGLKFSRGSRDDLVNLSQGIRRLLPVDTILIHPTSCACACGPDGAFLVEGPFTQNPKITTGAGDHFNSGFCLGKLTGLDTHLSLLTGVTTSGHYVRTAESPRISQLCEMLRNWPNA
jgi:sugar/nucleoside kinase (ribokinase family)